MRSRASAVNQLPAQFGIVDLFAGGGGFSQGTHSPPTIVVPDAKGEPRRPHPSFGRRRVRPRTPRCRLGIHPPERNHER